MIFVDGFTILGCNRSGANPNPNSQLFTIPSVDTVDGTTPILPGDLCVILDLVYNNTAAVPTSVTPTGFTAIGSSSAGTTEAGDGARANLSYRILPSGDIGGVKTGMSYTDNARKMVCVFRMNRPLQSVTPLNFVINGPQGGDPALVTGSVSGVSGNVLMLAMAASSGSISVANFVLTGANGSDYVSPADADDATGGTASETKSAFGYYPSGKPPVAITVNIPDLGIVNVAAAVALVLE